MGWLWGRYSKYFYILVEDHEPEEKIPPLSPLKDEIIKYIEETNSFVFTSGKVMHYSTGMKGFQ